MKEMKNEQKELLIKKKKKKMRVKKIPNYNNCFNNYFD